MFSTLCLVRKLVCRRTIFSSAANPAHATATAMHFPANAGLIFLTDKLTNDRYLVDTGATLSIVPCSQKFQFQSDGRSSVSDGRSSASDGRSSVSDGRSSVSDGRSSVSDGHSSVG